jgi:hypothetical protein
MHSEGVVCPVTGVSGNTSVGCGTILLQVDMTVKYAELLPQVQLNGAEVQDK